APRHARGGRRARDRAAEASRGRHNRSAAQRAALRLAPQHHEGEEEAHRHADARGARRRRRAAPRHVEGRGAAEASGGQEGGKCPGAPRQAPQRSAGDLTMTVLVLAEHDNKTLKGATLNAVSAAQAIGGEIHILVAGDGARPAAEAAARIPGVAKVRLAEDPALAHGLAENVAPLLAKLAGEYSHVLAAATTSGKNIMPRVAALLDVMQVSD